MNQFSGFPQLDPSKMDPKVLMQLSELMRQLPPSQINQMQSLMHNMMAGHNVSAQMLEFEKSLPPGFKEKMTALMGGGLMETPEAFTSTSSSTLSSSSNAKITTDDLAKMDIRGARLTLLHAVADGKMTPTEAEQLLFPH